jgi:hypothetical protein
MLSTVRGSSGRHFKNIQDIQVGARVLTEGLPKEAESTWQPTKSPGDHKEVDPAGWRQVHLRMADSDGDRLDIVLLRPLAWLEVSGAFPGREIHLGLPEMGIDGLAEVLAVDPCPSIPPGPGRLVTGTFSHDNVPVLDLRLEGVAEALGVTPGHPIWSEDRQAFVPAAKLKVGERLHARAGQTRVVAVTPREGRHRVYNLEVEQDHVYYVSKLQVLVHNASPGPTSFPTKGMGGRTLSAAEQAEFEAFAQRTKNLGLVENPNRTGSWGKMVGGKFKEVTRIDVAEAGKPGFRGKTHIHIDGTKGHLDPTTPLPGE